MRRWQLQFDSEFESNDLDTNASVKEFNDLVTLSGKEKAIEEFLKYDRLEKMFEKSDKEMSDFLHNSVLTANSYLIPEINMALVYDVMNYTVEQAQKSEFEVFDNVLHEFSDALNEFSEKIFLVTSEQKEFKHEIGVISPYYGDNITVQKYKEALYHNASPELILELNNYERMEKFGIVKPNPIGLTIIS